MDTQASIRNPRNSVILSIVIITKDTKELLDDLLGSIQKDAALNAAKVIVVDNASGDGTGQMIEDKYPAVTFVRNEKNMGFAYSANKGFSLAEGDYTLFLNSDTIVIPGEFQKIVDFMERDKSVAVCGPQLVYADMKPQRSYAAIPSLAGEFFGGRFKVKGSRLKVTAGQTHGPAALRSAPSAQPPATHAYDVPSLIGAAIVVRSDFVRNVDGFDERFFFFLEETDLCVRMRNAGGRIVFLSDARIIHLQGKTVRKSWIDGRIEYNISLNKFIRKHHSSVYYNVFKTIRFLKAFFAALVFPLLLADRTMRIKYLYNVRLFYWYLTGCPDNAGIRRQN
ncbi:MAG TPA: glycosyltransferase family 2 protein [Syntrophorhabdaceae bacterium]|nr:glycosyltransferase family 2 protein [Syntrophorhabdaceae bacterium]